jgi:nucleotide-binding universal stress UspA family protein
LQSESASAPSLAKILVPVDGSEHALRAVRVASEMASKYNADLILLSVVASPGFALVGPVGAPADLSDYYKVGNEEARAAVEKAAVVAKEAGVRSTGKVVQPVTSAGEAIVEFATSEKVDMIVMGTRGLGGFKKLVLGSVSSGVVAGSPCSVLVVR